MKPALYFFFAATLTCTSCLKTDPSECHVSTAASALAVRGSRQLAVNQPASFILDYQFLNSCGKPNGFDEQVNGNTRTISILTYYDGCSCAAVVAPAQATYTFTPTQAGTYYLKFARDGGFLIDTLTVK